MSKSLLELSGYPLLMIEAFLVSAASLGGCFANLQKINTVISDGTYDPRAQSTYWTRWMMGVISGIVLSQIVYDFFLAHSGTTRPSTRYRPRSGNRSSRYLADIPSISFTEFSTVRSIQSAISSESQWTVGSTVRSGAGWARRLAIASELAELQRALAANPDMGEIRHRLEGLIQRISLTAG
jgi:hypothetical protein